MDWWEQARKWDQLGAHYAIQTICDGGLEQDGSSRGDVKQSNSGCILKGEPTGFAVDLDVAQERKRGQE